MRRPPARCRHRAEIVEIRNKPRPRIVRCSMEYDAIIGVGAAILTSLSHWPQLKKCWQTGKAEDLSLRAFVILAVGVALWLVYGVLKSDWIIMAANAVSLALLCGILFFKIRGATTLPADKTETPWADRDKAVLEER